MQWVVAALLACGCVSLAEVADWPPADDYIANTSCTLSAAPDACRHNRETWTHIYKTAVDGLYESQRSVSLCLSTGCDGAITPNRVQGCAWRQVIVGSKHPQLTADDTAAVARYCGSDALDDADRQSARDQSKVWLELLGVAQ